MDEAASPFLAIPSDRWVAANELAFAVRDGFPVSDGHTLVVTRRLVPDFFACTEAERAALMALVDVVRRDLDETHHPDGYNVGFNAGAAAGQTVPHVHVHVIPRYRGDVDDPRGGVRHVIPGRGNYLRARAEPLTDGLDGRSLYRALAPLLSEALRVDLLAAFVQDGGVSLIAGTVAAALARGACFRVLTGDYLDITQASALRRLLDWSLSVDAARRDDETPAAGRFEVRVVETACIRRAFHPKSWRIEGERSGVAFVGSSNLSRSALLHGVEWNLRVDRDRDPAAYARVAESFEALWATARVLDEPWLRDYADRAKTAPAPHLPGELSAEVEAPPEPNAIQRQALDALAAARASGRERALVVMATGLGKTLLAAFDLAQIARALGRTPSVLWVAHRRELLDQAAASVRRVFPDARFAWWMGGRRPDEPFDVVFASVQTLARRESLRAIAPDRFDVVVVDEAHHAHAESYRRALSHFSARIRLGLTATPDRADEGDVHGLFDDHVAFRADIGVGVRARLLVPFAYFGLKDTTDYAPIPWRGGRFDVDALSAAVQTQARMEKLWEAWNDPARPGTRTLVFCASLAHGAFVTAWLRSRGVRVAFVHSGAGSDDRTASLDDLEAGRIDAVCSVDLFNEGVDCRPVDRVVMLRPTESPVMFLQQLGRGLRTSEAKERLTVLDFVGNHRVFLDRVRTLVTLADEAGSARAFLEARRATLPEGCSVDLELEAVDLLRRLLPHDASGALLDAYRERRAARGERPRAGELVRSGHAALKATAASGGWFALVAGEGDLDAQESLAFAAAKAWLIELQSAPMTRCFKMVVVDALLDADALFEGMPLGELAARCHAYLLRSPELFEDVVGVSELPDPRAPSPTVWRRYWAGNPIAAWTRGRWFRVADDRLVFSLDVEASLRPAIASLTRELVDARLAAYRRRKALPTGAGGFELKVIWNRRDPILKLPDGVVREALPSGDVDVRTDDGAAWRFRFAKIMVNVAHRVGSDRNGLPDLLRGWFGLSAGRPGTDFRVRFRATPDGWWIEPVEARAVEAMERGLFVSYPSLQAAAGVLGRSDESVRASAVRLPGAPSDARFAVRVSGDSMDGGASPMRDGDWAVLQLCRGVGLGAVEGRVVLVAVERAGGEVTHHLKRVVRRDGVVALRSDHPDVPPMDASRATVIARLEGVVRPESLAPAEGSEVADGGVAARFGVTEEPTTGVSRRDGHLFLLVEGVDAMRRPDRVPWVVRDRGPGETAFVLVRPRAGEPWTYLGVARWREQEGGWVVPRTTLRT